MKTCSKCGIEKPFDEFSKNKVKKDGYCGYCKECDSTKGKKYYSLNKDKKREYIEKNKDRIKLNKREYQLKNKEYFSKKSKEYQENNKEKIIAYQKEYRAANKGKIKKLNKKWNSKNKDYIRIQKREYFLSNKEKTKEYFREYYKTKQKNDIVFKLNKNISWGIRDSLRGDKNGHHWETLVNYSQEDLRNHLESQFKDGMSWDNYGKWHIDHRIPISIFNITGIKSKGFKECWSLENLQPMWAEENNRKNNTLFY